MDTTGFSQVGRYGTLSLLKKRSLVIPGSNPNGTSNTTTPSPEQSQVITSFGIDSANLTFGRAPTCDVRLYYPAVDLVHCRVINEDGKAFLVIQGKSGVLVDGCWVYPTSSSFSNSESQEQHSIIPLTNNCEFEIHGKRFQFTYPPKEVRKVLLATPVANRNRTLRLSMIQSAQVFSPRPSHDPRENLRILQSPIKASILGAGSNAETSARSRSQSPTKPRAVSPLKFGIAADGEDSDEDDIEEHDENEDDEARGRPDQGEEDIVLVHTNHPRVVEEERDLVILEDVPLHLILPSPSVYSDGSPVRSGPQQGSQTLVQQQHTAQPQPQPLRTPPRRKSIGGTALHRAVLIRSAQRAIWKAEKEREEEEEREEEMEVLGAVVDPVDGDEGGNDDGSDEEQEDVEMRSVSDEEESADDEGEDDQGEDEKSERKPLWRKGIERIIPWPFSPKKEDNDEQVEEHSDEDGSNEQEDQEDENETPAPLSVMPQQPTPVRRPLGSFMTPQPQARQPIQQPRKEIFPAANSVATAARAPAVPATAPGPGVGPGRYSLGGGEARRVVVQQPWRVNDLVVPPITASTSGASLAAPAPLRAMDPPSTPAETRPLSDSGTSTVKPPVSEEERRAIQERRRSAARELREDSFWKDGAPGMSPAKVRSSPAKPVPGLGVGRPSVMGTPANMGLSTTMGTGMAPRRPLFASPTKGRSLGYSIAEADAEEGDSLFLDSTGLSSKAMPKETATKAAEDDEESLDANGLLERMRETVENMKRRRSVVPPVTPKAMLVEEANSSTVETEETGSRESIKKLDFTRVIPAASRKLASPLLSSTEATPKPAPLAAGSYSVESARHILDEEVRNESKEPEPFSLLRPGARPSSSQKKHDEPSAVEEETHAVPLPLPIVDVDAAEEESEDQGQTEARARGRGRRRPRLLRAPKAKEEATQPEEDDREEAVQAKPKSAAKPRSKSAKSPGPPATTLATALAPEPSGSGPRRQRSKTPQPRPEVEPEAEVEQAPPRSSGAKRTRKGTAEAEEPVVAPKSRGRKAAEPEVEVVEEEEAQKAKPAPAKRGRKPRVAPVDAVIEEDEVDETPAVAPAKRGRPKKVKEPEPAPEEDEDEDDELDSYHVPTAVAGSSKTTGKTQIQPPTQLKGRKKPATAAAAVKQEPVGDDDDEPAPLAVTRVGRGARANLTAAATKTPGPSGATKNKIPTTTATTTGKTTAGASKPRGRPKTPASAPAGATVTSAAVGDSDEKENTPRTASGSANGGDDVQEEPVVKVRVSRRAGANTATTTVGSSRAVKSVSKIKAKAPVKVEQGEDEELVAVGTGRTRATRIMRTRTKTG